MVNNQINYKSGFVGTTFVGTSTKSGGSLPNHIINYLRFKRRKWLRLTYAQLQMFPNFVPLNVFISRRPIGTVRTRIGFHFLVGLHVTREIFRINQLIANRAGFLNAPRSRYLRIPKKQTLVMVLIWFMVLIWWRKHQLWLFYLTERNEAKLSILSTI